MIEITNEAITKILEKQGKESFDAIRLDIFDSCNDSVSSEDVRLDYGKFAVLIDKMSVPYLVGMTLDYQKEGLNEVFKFINPKEQSSCGCGVSINFDLEKVKVDENKIFAVEM